MPQLTAMQSSEYDMSPASADADQKHIGPNKHLRLVTTGLIIVVLICCGIRIYHSYIPWGAELFPYISSVDGGTIQSPNGDTYAIRFNDAGAMHSGNHWTWLTSRNTLLGKYVVTEGYLGSEHAVDGKTIPLKWNNERPIVDFLEQR